MLSPPFITVTIETLSVLLIAACLSVSGSSLIVTRKPDNLQTPINMGAYPRNPIGSVGMTYETPKPIMLMMTITVNPMNCPRVVLRGVIVLLVVASEKKVTRTNMSSILVMANEAHATPTDFPKCIVKVRLTSE